MKMRHSLELSLVATLIIVLVCSPMASAGSSCPANDPNIGPYNKVTILPERGYKLVNEKFTVYAVRVDKKVESPLIGRSVKIYLVKDEKKTIVASGLTGADGKFSHTPAKVGKYAIEVVGKYITMDVWQVLSDPTETGAVCGNGRCEDDKGETTDNCPEDCTTCGDAVCEGLEDKQNCPDDCIICGDGECDPAEYWPGGCSCIEDCVICGDGACDTLHGENSSVCPADCEEVVRVVDGDFIEDNWWILIIIIAVGLTYFFRDRIEEVVYDVKTKTKRKKGKKPAKIPEKKKRKRKSMEEDEGTIEIIIELMETGVSDNKIIKKLKEFGVEHDEAVKLIEKAKEKW